MVSTLLLEEPKPSDMCPRVPSHFTGHRACEAFGRRASARSLFLPFSQTDPSIVADSYRKTQQTGSGSYWQQSTWMMSR